MSSIESFKQEERVFNSPVDFVNNAAISGMDAYRALCTEAAEDYEGFWAVSYTHLTLPTTPYV